MTITETLAQTVAVEAEDAAGAESIVRDMYARCEIVLAAEDRIHFSPASWRCCKNFMIASADAFAPPRLFMSSLNSRAVLR